jgi:hypothetical protein
MALCLCFYNKPLTKISLFRADNSFFFKSAAAQLSFLLHVCILNDITLPLCIWLLLGVHNQNQRRRKFVDLESNAKDSGINRFDHLLLHMCMVCGWFVCLPFLPDEHEPGWYHRTL